MSFSKMLPFLRGHIRYPIFPPTQRPRGCGTASLKLTASLVLKNGCFGRWWFFSFWGKRPLFSGHVFQRGVGILHSDHQVLGRSVTSYRPKKCCTFSSMLCFIHWEDASESDPSEKMILLLRMAVLHTQQLHSSLAAATLILVAPNTQLHQKPTASAFIFRVHVKKKTKEMTSRPGMSQIQILRQKVPILTTSGLPFFERFLL